MSFWAICRHQLLFKFPKYKSPAHQWQKFRQNYDISITVLPQSIMLTISGSGFVFAVVCTGISNAQTIESVVAPRTNLAIAQRDIDSRTNLSPNSANSRNQHNRSHTYVFIALLIPSVTCRNGNRLPVYLKPYEKTRPIILLLISWPFPPSGYEHTTWQWRHNERDAISNHRRLDCLPNHLLRYRSNYLSKLHAIGLCEEIYRWPVDSHHKGPVTRRMFLFD